MPTSTVGVCVGSGVISVSIDVGGSEVSSLGICTLCKCSVTAALFGNKIPQHLNSSIADAVPIFR